MLRNTKDLDNCTIAASDGPVGKIKDVYFDDRAWVVRYLVVETGSRLSRREVLISPLAAGALDLSNKSLPVSITQAQVRSSPNIDTAKPVSRQHEESLLSHYGYPYYWVSDNYWGLGLRPSGMIPIDPERAHYDETRLKADAEKHRDDDPHLRSANTIVRYKVHAIDGAIGHVQCVLMDDQTWAIRYLVAYTSNWWLGHEVLISPEWIDNICWNEMTVNVNLTREAVKGSPTYHSAAPLRRELEMGTYTHYGRPGYWRRDTKPAAR